MRPSIDRPRIVAPRYSMTWPMPPPVPISPMTARITSLAVTPAGSSPSTSTAIHFGRRLRQRLGGQDVLDLARADAEGERAERAVRRRVAVAADDRHARQRAALLGADDVDDALAGVAHREVGDAELGRVLAQHLDLAGRDRVGDRLVDVLGRDVVVLGRDRQLGAAHPAAAEAQAVERLRAGDLVDEVQVDVEEVGLARRRAHEVALPHLLRQGSWCAVLSTCVSHPEIVFLTSGQRIERRGPRQGRCRAPRAGARSGRAGSPSCRPSTGLPRATAHRLAGALEQHGLVRRDGAGRFCLGLALVGLGHAAAAGFPLADLARPALTALRDETGESVQLFVREGDGRRCVVSLQSAHGLRWIVPEGALLPLRVGSAGRVLSGELGPAGWVESVEEREAGVASVSAPVTDGGRRARRGQRERPGRAAQPPPGRALRRPVVARPPRAADRSPPDLAAIASAIARVSDQTRVATDRSAERSAAHPCCDGGPGRAAWQPPCRPEPADRAPIARPPVRRPSRPAASAATRSSGRGG